MEESVGLKYLKTPLVLIGAFCIVGVFPLTIYWPSGWAWHTEGPSLYLQMIIGIYATLGVFLIIAARNPLEHLSLIWFMVWSSIVHGGIMAIQSLVYPQHRASSSNSPRRKSQSLTARCLKTERRCYHE